MRHFALKALLALSTAPLSTAQSQSDDACVSFTTKSECMDVEGCKWSKQNDVCYVKVTAGASRADNRPLAYTDDDYPMDDYPMVAVVSETNDSPAPWPALDAKEARG